MPIWKRTSLSYLALFGITTSASYGATKCPKQGADNITVQLDNGSPPMRRQVVHPGDTISWHQVDDYRHTKVFIVFDDPSVCEPTSGPADGTCKISSGTIQTTPPYHYRYCPSNLAADPNSAACPGKATHDILVQPSPGTGLTGDADLELEGTEVHHFIRNADTCVSWQDANSIPAPVSFNNPKPKLLDCTAAANGGVISCYIPWKFLRWPKKLPYSICTAGYCTDPTIHILGAGDMSFTFLGDHLALGLLGIFGLLFGVPVGIFVTRRRARNRLGSTGSPRNMDHPVASDPSSPEA